MEKILLDSDSIKRITLDFYNRYKNPETNLIDLLTAETLIKDIYSSMGIKNYYLKKDGEDLINLFGSQKSGISYSDLEKVFFRYLSGKVENQNYSQIGQSQYYTRNFSETKTQIFRLIKKTNI
jgi:hypothetical protein